MAAREAFQKGNIERLSRIAPDLQDYPSVRLRHLLAAALAPEREQRAGGGSIHVRPSRHACSPSACARDWLRVLARNQDWEAFERGYRGRLRSRIPSSPAMRCRRDSSRIGIRPLSRTRVRCGSRAARSPTAACRCSTRWCARACSRKTTCGAASASRWKSNNLSLIRQIVALSAGRQATGSARIRDGRAQSAALSRSPFGEVEDRAPSASR